MKTEGIHLCDLKIMAPWIICMSLIWTALALSPAKSGLESGRFSSAPFRDWSDCLGVVKKVRRLQEASFPPRAMDLNGDLWSRVWRAIQDLEVQFQINHVPSHQDPGEFDSLTIRRRHGF